MDPDDDNAMGTPASFPATRFAPLRLVGIGLFLLDEISMAFHMAFVRAGAEFMGAANYRIAEQARKDAAREFGDQLRGL